MPEPGIYYDISNADYHADTSAIGNSGLKAVRHSPAYYYGQYLDPNRPGQGEEEEESAARLFGNMTHCALFEPDAFESRYPVGWLDPELKKPKQGKAWQQQKAEAASRGGTLVDQAQVDRALRVREACLAVPGIAQFFTGHWHGEVSIYARDPETGVLCKIRADLLYIAGHNPAGKTNAVILDGKSYSSTDPGDFTRQIARMDYDMQTAFYHDVATWAGYAVLGHLYLAFEMDYPHLPRLFELDKESFLNGRRKYRKALNTYAECVKAGRWPGPADAIETITLPDWAMEHE